MAETLHDQRRDTSIAVLELESGEAFIVVSLSAREDSQVISIDPTTGALTYTGRQGFDNFDSESEAIQHVTAGLKWPPVKTVYARAILGYLALGNVGLLLLATKVRASIQNLPGGDSVYLVEESQWFKVNLRNPQPLSKSEIKNIGDLQDIDIDGMHFFCETRDLTRPFPSEHLVSKYDQEFVWNEWLSRAFKDLGLSHHCVVLLQGVADSRVFTDSQDVQVAIALIARRSRLHPGTRYLARGLNATCSTGNEVECEQLIWPLRTSHDQSLPFSVYLWRRGTVPIWWKAEIKSTVGEAEICVSDIEPYKGADDYFRRLDLRYGHDNMNVERFRNKHRLPIVCVNLLRTGFGKPEVVLTENFQRCVNYVGKKSELTNAMVSLVNYDWHANTKLIGDARAVEKFWQLLKPSIMDVGFYLGDYLPSIEMQKNADNFVIHNRGLDGGVFRLTRKQYGILRFNCADSLDRTNAASFFVAVQVMTEQCRNLGILLDFNRCFQAKLSFNERSAESETSKGFTRPLPLGWESRTDVVTGKVFYIDHNTRKTTWNHPCPDKPWRRLDMMVEEFKQETLPSAIAVLADMFLAAGDVHATLYTGSKAMHSHILQIFSEESAKSKQYLANNMRITLQRRYLNVIVDSSRQKQLEMFLGLSPYKHLPTIRDRALQVLSRPHSSILKPVQSSFPSIYTTNDLINIKRKDLIWVCPAAAEVVELFIFLAQPSHACQILLTIGHGSDDITSPISFDVRTGRYLDRLKLVLEGATIPKCANGTKLLYCLPGAMNPEDVAITGAGSQSRSGLEEQYFPWLYDFEEQEGELDFMTRVVAVTFYPSSPGRIPITLGEIEVLGVSLPWENILSNVHSYIELEKETTAISMRTKNPFLDKENAAVPMTTKNPFLERQVGTNDLFEKPNMTAKIDSNSNLLGHGLDLLTGDISLSNEASPTEMLVPNEERESVLTDSWDLFSTSELNSAGISRKQTISPLSSTSAKEAVQDTSNEYIRLLKEICSSEKVEPVDFFEAMQLEISRLYVGLSAAERDRALLSLGVDPASLDPNRLLSSSHVVQLCQIVNQLNIINEKLLEDETLAAIGFPNLDKKESKLSIREGLLNDCTNPACQIKIKWKYGQYNLPTQAPRLWVCGNCDKKVCDACMVGRAAALLACGSISSGNFAEASMPCFIHGSPIPEPVLCKRCCPQIFRDAILLDTVKSLASLRRRRCITAAALDAEKEILADGGTSSFSLSCEKQDSSGCENTSQTWLQTILQGDSSLAEFPYATLLTSVDTEKGSASPLCLLLNPFLGQHNSYWKAPSCTKSVDLTIGLTTLSIVSRMILLVSSCGYSKFDAPIVEVWCGNWISEKERTYVGRWDLAAKIAASPLLYGAESSGKRTNPQHIVIEFKKSHMCRIIWLKLTLQSSCRKPSSLTGDNGYDLLSLNWTGSHETSQTGLVAYPTQDTPCIHARRIIIVGKHLREDADMTLPAQASERFSWRSMMEQPSQLGRFKVQIQAEKCRESDRIVEQVISPSAPSIAGFRVDSLSLIKNFSRCIPLMSGGSIFNFELHDMEGLIFNSSSLFIRVAALQDTSVPVPVGCYMLPIAPVGTLLYFDFPKPIQARELIFELIGDVARFSQEITEGDSAFRDPPLPTGLSLANKIRLYRYASNVEMGKWALLSGV